MNKGSAAANFAAHVSSRYLSAKERGSLHYTALSIGGTSLELNILGANMSRSLCQSLAHLLADEAQRSEMKIFAWDAANSGVSLQCPKLCETELGSHGIITELSDERFTTLYHLGPNALSLIDREHRRAYYYTRDAADLPYYERANPFRNILHVLLSSQSPSLPLLHAAAVAKDTQAVLLVGKAGSGKTSTALSAIERGFTYLADDHCLLDLRNDSPQVHSLYCSAKVLPDTLERNPSLKRFVAYSSDTADRKLMLDIFGNCPESQGRSAKIAAIVLPRLSDTKRSNLSPLAKRLALLALAPSTIFQLPRIGTAQLQAYKHLVSLVPSYQLDLGVDSSHTISLLSSILDN